MRTGSLLRLIRMLPPKYQLGVGVLLVAGIGAVWLAGQMGYQSQIDEFAGTFRLPSNSAPDVRARKPASENASHASAATGNFSYYSLALSWSPTYCETSGRGRKDRQCSGQRPYAFVLHGLWPQHDKGWPENCRTGQKPFVPNSVIRSMTDIMPSRGLIIHEYKKHGTCSGLAPNDYFSFSRSLYNKVR
ncbi:MAG: ribonuclease T2 family protein, partial [Methyloligellaceae bacterium]